MDDGKRQEALNGLSVVELGPGTAAAYCGRLLADAGASVVSIDASGLARDASPAEQSFAAWLTAGKTVHDAGDLLQACREADLVVAGEDSSFDLSGLDPRCAVVRLAWFGPDGAYRDWKGSDLVIQALTAMPHLVGPVEGPPIWAGDRHSSLIAGVTAYIAAFRRGTPPMAVTALQDGGYVVPLKDLVRKAENLDVGDVVTIRLTVAL